MDKEGLSEDSTHIWTKSIIQKYEERPQDLDSVNLAQFVAWYTPVQTRSTRRNRENIIIDDADDMELKVPSKMHCKTMPTQPAVRRLAK